jgi:hypothetical protein
VDDDAIAAQMTALRIALVGGSPDESYKAGRTLWDALQAALNVHRPGMRVMFACACSAHHPAGVDDACPDCEPEVRTRICGECRDEAGDPLPFGECRVRKAVLTALTGEVRRGT